ncbi:MAG: esterase-like activity of phytase family protein [Chitinophagaceae bacterium]|nr:esterase-like activity of phytase family protein [Chitinophagaceae bacterium]MBL0274301.1 esterase-like activity of phytase family protein [Chitinophagaceae bacterium]
MRLLSLISMFLFGCSRIVAQPPNIQSYTIAHINLPADMNKQVCISGMKFYNGQLYFASERCPSINVFDPVKSAISHTIPLNVPQNFEMEGMTSFKDKLYLVSENIAAVYEVTMATGAIKSIQTSIPLPEKSKSGDGMEGIAANENHNKFYLLRERNEDMTKSQIYTFNAEPGNESSSVTLKYESRIELPLENPQWRYSDICVDSVNRRLLCLKSYSKGKLRQQFLESIDIDDSGQLRLETLKNIPVENFTEVSNTYKTQDYSMNLEGITIDNNGTIYIVSDNTSGKANCELEAKEKTILLQLIKK